MLFGKMISSYENTNSIIRYKLMFYEGVNFNAYSILKCNTIHNTYTYIVKGIKSKDAVMLIWDDILQGIQK